MSHSEHPRIRFRDVALLAAFALFLSTVEYVIPKPLPYMRIGLANLAVMIGLYAFSLREYTLLVLLKILGQGVLHGTLFSYVFLFSLGGSIASAVVMLLLFRLIKQHITMLGISVAGAFASNIVQILLARYLLFGRSAWLIAPPFLIAGLIASVILGLFAQRFIDRSRWVDLRLQGEG